MAEEEYRQMQGTWHYNMSLCNCRKFCDDKTVEWEDGSGREGVECTGEENNEIGHNWERWIFSARESSVRH